MTPNRRLAAVVMALLLPGLGLAAWVRAGVEPALVAPPSLPREAGPWTATEEQRLEPELLEEIEPDEHLFRLYEAPGRTPVWVYLGLYAGSGGYEKTAHDPEVCYPAQGWEVLGSRSIEVPIPAAQTTLRARLLDAHRGLESEAVLYWFQPAGRWPSSGALEELLHLADAVSRTTQHAFVRLSAPSEDHPQAPEDLVELAGLLAPALRAGVESMLEPPSARPGP